MESKPKYRDVAERAAQTRPEAIQTSGAGKPGGPKKSKLSWKSILAAAVAIVIGWQLYHAFIASGKSSNTGARSHGPAATSGAPAPKPTPKPTPTPTVTLGGHKISAAAGPVIVLNPGLV